MKQTVGVTDDEDEDRNDPNSDHTETSKYTNKIHSVIEVEEGTNWSRNLVLKIGFWQILY